MKRLSLWTVVFGMCLFSVSTARAQQDPGFIPVWDDFLNLIDSLIFQTADGRLVIDTSTTPGNPILKVNNSGNGPALDISSGSPALGASSSVLRVTGSLGIGLGVSTGAPIGQAIDARCTLPGSDCYGILAVGTNIGILASGPRAAGRFDGNVNINGTLTKTSGMFKIDHPLDPANRYLSHSFVESPDMMNIYNGVAALDRKGEAWVSLPDWFEALNREFRYQLTAIGAPAPNLYIAREVSGNRFKIAGGKSGGKVSWQVTGIRQDAYANAHRVQVEEDKALGERGYYLHPEVFGQPATKNISALRRPTSVPAASNSGETAGRR